MNRKAILIESSNVTGLNDLPGARVDIHNWKNFLRSDLGGAWTDSEIVVLNKPFSKGVKDALTVVSDCYCFVAFSGHGCNETVALNDYVKELPIEDLKPKGDKGTLIVDSCRGVEEARDYRFGDVRGIAIANEALDGRVLSRASRGHLVEFPAADVAWEKKSTATSNHRQIWCSGVKQSAKGVVQMLACSKGQAAGENPQAGGYYTSLLMQSADLWNKKLTTDKIHTTKAAHDYAASALPPQQTPEYLPSGLKFPFAAKV